MPRQPRQFITDEIYHIVIRRIGNELLFGDINDYFRGIFSIYEFNTANPVIIKECRAARSRFKKTSRGPTPGSLTSMIEKDRRDLLVENLVFCFMPNHIHLLLRELKDGGISRFMQKLEGGYSAYSKNKYGLKLRGHFFQDRFNAVHIETEEQLRTVFVYIHINPIALLEPNWKEEGIRNPEKAIKFLEKEYRWSSLWDYLNKKNFPSVTEREFLLEIMGGPENCKKAIEDWVRYKGEIREFAKISL